MPPTEKDLAAFCKFLNENRILIADPSSASRVRLAATLSELGVRTANLTLCSNSDEAIQHMKALKPKLVLADYVLGTMSGLDLLQLQRAEQKSDDSVFILVTGNTSQSAVARAAEEDVDAFILKPYTLESLKVGLVNAVIGKIFPSDYIRTIKEGKDLMFAQKLDEAIEVFERATKLDPAPTLAHFYKGYVLKMKRTLEGAEVSYKDGLGLNKIHYKCLIGMFDLLIEEKRQAEAYDVVKRIAAYFPANPKRLASVLRLAIMTEHYEDMEGYYRTFTQIEQRSDELVTYMCSALIVCGKYYLMRNHRTRAVEVFEKAAVSCAGQTRFLRYIVETLVDKGQSEAAVPFFKRYAHIDKTSIVFRTLEFLVSNKKEELSMSITKGQSLLKAGVKDPLVYRIMVECCGKGGLNDAAINIGAIGMRDFPAQRREFEVAIETFVKTKDGAPKAEPAPKAKANRSDLRSN
jgi:CheY-like chemotaxis protein